MTSHILANQCNELVDQLEGKQNIFGAGAAITPDGATTTCSTFLTLVLKEMYDVNPVVWVALFGDKWPRARDYYSAFSGLLLGGNSDVALEDIQKGTLAAIGYVDDREGMSGHCFICLGRPIATRRLFGDLEEYSIEIVDSCRSHHGEGDTRIEKPGGIGIGIMALLVDTKKEVQGYRWSLSVASELMHNGRGQRIAFANIPADWRLRNG